METALVVYYITGFILIAGVFVGIKTGYIK